MSKIHTNYDFVFVLPGFSLTPAGGYMVIFELAVDLQRKGYAVLIIFLRRLYYNLYAITQERAFLDTYRPFGLIHRVLSKVTLLITPKNFHFFLDIAKKLGFNVNENAFTFLKDFRFVIKDNIPKHLDTKRLIATAWGTAYFVNKYSQKTIKYYLVQNSEDDVSFSGSLSKFATRTYSFPLKKIVINRVTQNRFVQDNPIKITVASHVNAELRIDPKDRMGCIAIQLRNGEDKGAEYAIGAIKIIHDRHKEIRIESYGNYKGAIPDFVVHHGFMPEEDYINMFNRSTIFILPSIVEGFSTPVLESMTCGSVPVATKCGGPEEMIENNVNGILVPIKSPNAIAEAVGYLLSNNETRISMAHNAIDTSKRYTREAMYQSFINGIKNHESY